MSKEGRSKYDDATEVALSTESLPPELQAKIAAAQLQARARAAGLEAAPPPAPPVQPSAPVERPAWMVDETIALGSGPGAVELPAEILALRRAAQTRTAMAIETPPMARSPLPLRDETMLVQPSTAFVQPAGDVRPQPPSAPSSLDALLAAPPPGVHVTSPVPPPSLAEPPPLPVPTPVPTADLFAHLAGPPPPPAVNPIPPTPNWTSPAPDRTFELSADAARAFAPSLPQSHVVPAASTAPTPSPSHLQPAPPAPWTAPAAATPVAWQPPVPPAPTTRQQAPRSRSNPYGFDEPTTAFMAEHVEVRNKTEAVVVTRAHGVGALVVIKQRYFLSRRGELSPVPGASAQEADEHFADPLGGSLRIPSDFGGPHAGTDVLVLGDAIAVTSPFMRPPTRGTATGRKTVDMPETVQDVAPCKRSGRSRSVSSLFGAPMP